MTRPTSPGTPARCGATSKRGSPSFVRDIWLLLISLLLFGATLYIYVRLRSNTFRRIRHLLEERVEVKTRQLVEKNLELEQLSLVASRTDNSVLIAAPDTAAEEHLAVEEEERRQRERLTRVSGKGVPPFAQPRHPTARPLLDEFGDVTVVPEWFAFLVGVVDTCPTSPPTQPPEKQTRRSPCRLHQVIGTSGDPFGKLSCVGQHCGHEYEPAVRSAQPSGQPMHKHLEPQSAG